MNDIYLLTGGNVGDRFDFLEKAFEMIETIVGPVVGKSSVYETAPWGFTDQQPFLNQAICIASALEPEELLQKLLSIELQLGRKRLEKMGPRVIDIDILFYSTYIVSQPDLIIPHPRIAERRFVLTPLNEIAPEFVHPTLGKKIDELLESCNDKLEVKLYKRTV
jgi:2-amino-4-hydroxy-6-hydroxymethyldihydropteridine diphosphokinase